MLKTSETARRVIGIAIDLHRSLGPGLFEQVYRRCLHQAMTSDGLKVVTEMPIEVRYRDIVLECGYRADLVINDELIVEVKSVEQLLPVHKAQLLTYLKFSGLWEGLLMNFNEARLVDGIRSALNG